MRVVLQRVKECNVKVDNKIVGEIAQGFLLLLGVKDGDSQQDAIKLAKKISGLRIFTDNDDKMNLSLGDIDGSVLVVSNFTLYADCSHGRRPSFIKAARPEISEPLYEFFCEQLIENGISNVQRGIFGADMEVSLINDGPVTFMVEK